MRVLVLAAILLTSAPAQERPLPEFDTFAAEVRKRLTTDQSLQSGYVFRERRTEQRLDASGRVTKETVKVYETYPGLPGEGRYQQLIEENGVPVPTSRLARQDAERRKKAEEYVRKQASEPQQRRQVRSLDKARREYAEAVDDIFRVFDIRMVGRETLDGHDTIAATLTPRADARPLTDDGKVMRHFRARAWLSESDYELVRVELEALDTLSYGLGLLARIHKGTVATYERRKIDDRVWLPAEVSWTASARVLLLRRLRVRGISEFSDYRRYSVDTSTTIDVPR